MPRVELYSSFNLSPIMLARFARICTTPFDRSMLSLVSDRDKDMKLCKSLYIKGHWSVFEHASMTFLVECSRACSLQLARHRHISRTEMSQRYVKIAADNYEMPPGLMDEQKEEFHNIMFNAFDDYKRLMELFGMKPEDARGVLPNACKTRMFLTLNLRTLIELTQKRATNTGAQWEIAEVVRQMWEDIPLDIKDIFRPELKWLKDDDA